MHSTEGQAFERSASPTRVGPYDLLRDLGQGGMATLYVARHRHLANLVAFKRMRSTLVNDAVLSNRFLNEARIAARVCHPNVVRVFDYGVHDGVPYLVMDLLEGAPLSALIASGTPLETTRAVSLVAGKTSDRRASFPK